MNGGEDVRRRTVLAGMGAASLVGLGAAIASADAGSTVMPLSGNRVVDVHAHPILPEFRRFAETLKALSVEQAFADRPFLPPKLPDWSAASAIEAMDRDGVAAQMLSLPDISGALRGDYARRTIRSFNEALARIVTEAPARFGAFGVLPHDDMGSTLAELDYALGTLKLDGVSATANIRGVYLGDPSFDPWMKELDRRSAVLFVHPSAPAGTKPLSPTYLEFCFDTTRMLANLVLTGARRRFPNISIIATHGGGTMPFLAHRFELLEPLLGSSGLSAAQISADLRSIHYDLTTSMAAPSLAALQRFAGPDRLLMGFDTPYVRADLVPPELARFEAFDGLAARDRAAVRSGNALTLFPRLARAHLAATGDVKR